MMFQCCGNIVRAQYHLRKQRERAEAREREIAESLNTPSYLPNSNNLSNYIPQYNPVSPYQQELLGMPRKLILARELYNIFMPINLYQSANHKNRQSPLTQIYNAYHMKIDTTQWQRNRNNFSRLYQSLRNVYIPHQDILMMVGNPYAETIRSWKNIPEARRQIIRKEYPEMDVTTAAYLKWEVEHVRISNIKEGIDDCFADFVGFVTNVKSFQLGYKAWQAFKARKIVTTILNNAPKLTKSELIKANAAKGKRAEMRAQKVLGKDAIHDKYEFANGKMMFRGQGGKTRPDFIKGKMAIEVKSNDINKNSAGLIRSVVEQVKKRAVHLPKGYKQRVMIDITEQKVTKEAFEKVCKKIVEKCEGIITRENIREIGKFVE